MLIDRKESSIKISGVLGGEARVRLLKMDFRFSRFWQLRLTQNAVPHRINAGQDLYPYGVVRRRAKRNLCLN